MQHMPCESRVCVSSDRKRDHDEASATTPRRLGRGGAAHSCVGQARAARVRRRELAPRRARLC
eukprot:259931-Pleurochrysis_carterae.AAC.2